MAWNFWSPAFPLNSSMESTRGSVLGFGKRISFMRRKTEDTEIEIAHGEFLFSGNSDYASFNVPLSYNSFGIKATHLKIMFASTSNIGTIEDETMKIITTNDAPSASSIGSELWIDNLTFSY